jgi:hypothetical protein
MPQYLLMTHFNTIVDLHLGFVSATFLTGFATLAEHAFLFCPMRVIFAGCLIFLTVGEEYKL